MERMDILRDSCAAWMSTIVKAFQKASEIASAAAEAARAAAAASAAATRVGGAKRARARALGIGEGDDDEEHEKQEEHEEDEEDEEQASEEDNGDDEDGKVLVLSGAGRAFAAAGRERPAKSSRNGALVPHGVATSFIFAVRSWAKWLSTLDLTSERAKELIADGCLMCALCKLTWRRGTAWCERALFAACPSRTRRLPWSGPPPSCATWSSRISCPRRTRPDRTGRDVPSVQQACRGGDDAGRAGQGHGSSGRLRSPGARERVVIDPSGRRLGVDCGGTARPWRVLVRRISARGFGAPAIFGITPRSSEQFALVFVTQGRVLGEIRRVAPSWAWLLLQPAGGCS